MIVVDASVALAWVLPDIQSNQRYSTAIAKAGLDRTEELLAPRLLTTECSYRLLKYGRRNRWGEAKIAESAQVIDLFNIRCFDNADAVASLVRFAVRHHVQGYDAVYLGLAMQLGAKLATLDGGLKTATRAAGVEIT